MKKGPGKENDGKINKPLKQAYFLDSEILKKQILESMKQYANFEISFEKNFEILRPVMEKTVQDINRASQIYDSFFKNGNLINQVEKIQTALEDTMKSAIRNYEMLDLGRITYVPGMNYERSRIVSPQVVANNKLGDIDEVIIEKVVLRVFEKIEATRLNYFQTKKTELEIIKLPKDAIWYSVTIAVCKDDQQLEIHYKEELKGRISYRKLGLVMGNTTKSDDLNQAGKLLEALSLFQIKDDHGRDSAHKATVENLMRTLKIGDKQLFYNAKFELVRKLSTIIDSSPFEDYKKYGYYKPKFTLKPDSLFRSEEIHLQSSFAGIGENYDRDAEQSTLRSNIDEDELNKYA